MANEDMDFETMAKEALTNEQFEFAVDLYTHAIDLKPTQPELYADRAHAYVKLFNCFAAIDDANKALELDDSMIKAYMQKGIACMQLEQYETAMSAFQAGAILAPSNFRFQKFIKECSSHISDRTFPGFDNYSQAMDWNSNQPELAARNHKDLPPNQKTALNDFGHGSDNYSQAMDLNSNQAELAARNHVDLPSTNVGGDLRKRVNDFGFGYDNYSQAMDLDSNQPEVAARNHKDPPPNSFSGNQKTRLNDFGLGFDNYSQAKGLNSYQPELAARNHVDFPSTSLDGNLRKRLYAKRNDDNFGLGFDKDSQAKDSSSCLPEIVRLHNLLEIIKSLPGSSDEPPPAPTVCEASTSNSNTAESGFRHTYYQKPEEVIVTIYAKGIPASSVDVIFGKQLFSATIEIPDEEPYILNVRLYGKIISERCSYVVTSTEIEIHLAKAEAIRWASLGYNNKDEGVPTMKASPTPRTLPSTSFDGNQRTRVNDNNFGFGFNNDTQAKDLSSYQPETARLRNFLVILNSLSSDESPTSPTVPEASTLNSNISEPSFTSTYYQNPEEVIVTIYGKDIPPSRYVAVIFWEQIFNVTIYIPGEEPYRLNPWLFGKILSEKCSYEVRSTEIEIRLAKVEPIMWTKLGCTKKNSDVQKRNASATCKSPALQRPSYPANRPKYNLDKLRSELEKQEKELQRDNSLDWFHPKSLMKKRNDK